MERAPKCAPVPDSSSHSALRSVLPIGFPRAGLLFMSLKVLSWMGRVAAAKVKAWRWAMEDSGVVDKGKQKGQVTGLATGMYKSTGSASVPRVRPRLTDTLQQHEICVFPPVRWHKPRIELLHYLCNALNNTDKACAIF